MFPHNLYANGVVPRKYRGIDMINFPNGGCTYSYSGNLFNISYAALGKYISSKYELFSIEYAYGTHSCSSINLSEFSFIALIGISFSSASYSFISPIAVVSKFDSNIMYLLLVPL